MSDRSAHRRWLTALTDLPTASGLEQQVIGWVEKWVERRGYRLVRDDVGNLFIRPMAASRRRPIVAVAHLDHPALVVDDGGRSVTAELRGGVHSPYLAHAAVEVGSIQGRVVAYDGKTQRAAIEFESEVAAGSIARWRFRGSDLGIRDGTLRARSCDDLAGVAAALAALDVAAHRGIDQLGVLLTRAEEVGFVGAIAACKLGTVPLAARVISIEASQASAEAPLGQGPVVRVGDASSAFSAELTDQLSTIARQSVPRHQRRLMAGGSCEATAFCAFGYEASGLCLPLNNYHNMVDIEGVLAGRRKPRLAPEEISLSDFHGLVDLLVATAHLLDSVHGDLRGRLEDLYESERHVLAAPA